MFEPQYKAYYESLKNRDHRTGTTTQALPIQPADLKIIFAYLDNPQTAKVLTETRRLYFKAFSTTAFALWTRYVILEICLSFLANSVLYRNDELVNLQSKHVGKPQRSNTGIDFIEFHLIFRKTNKDPTKGKGLIIFSVFRC